VIGGRALRSRRPGPGGGGQ